jgi:glutamate carboxypeptidase
MTTAPDHQAHLHWIDQQLAVMRDELVQLAAINSGSFNAAGVNAVAQRLRALFAPLHANVETLPVAAYRSTTDDGGTRERTLGHALRLRKRPEAPLRIFFCGHMDTVFGAEHAFQHVRQTADDILLGPGVADLKGGLLVLFLALSALERSEWRERIGWEILFTPDEEIGSQGSAPLLAEAAQRNHFGLIYEPAFVDGHLAAQRKGSGNFDVIVHGRAAHAGREPHLGRNAIRAAADFIAALDELNGQREGLTINPGYVHGGGALNIVPERCVFKFNARTAQVADECWLRDQLDRLLTLINARDGFSVELRGGFNRPPKLFDAATQRLAGMIGACGRSLGLDLQFKPTGGCCDGNNLAALGLPNIDNLGVVGGEIHSDREFMHLSSLAERGKLSALLLLKLASGEMHWSAVQS